MNDDDPPPHTGSRRRKPRVSIACTICRAQHLRCDAIQPQCSRCRSLGKTCIYKDIRRGRQKQSSPHAQDEEPLANDDLVLEDSGLNDDLLLHLPPELDEQTMHYLEFQDSDLSMEIMNNVHQIHVAHPGTSRTIDAFYTYFFRGHPFVLPRQQLIWQFEMDPNSLDNLIPVLDLIGSLYNGDSTSSSQRLTAEKLYNTNRDLTPSGFTVQGLLLFTLVLEWHGENVRAEQTLERAKAMALAIQMNHQEFATRHGHGNEVLAESWRRTWWELYAVDANFAGIRHMPTFSLLHVDAHVDLPCEEEQYTSSNIPPSRTLKEYDNRGFDDNDHVFSSFTYLIDASRLLGSSLAAGDIAAKAPLSLVKNAEANILSWELHLPPCKKDSVSADAAVDEVLFRAQMVILSVSTHLHRTRSKLHYSTMELLCSQYAPPLPAETLPREERYQDRHTHKAIRAAKSFVDLLCVPVSSPIVHSPFIMCMGSMAMATHLSACEYLLSGAEYAHARDRVRVFLGILKAFEGVWPQAKKWAGEVKLMAKAVFDNRDEAGTLLLEKQGTATNMASQSGMTGTIEELLDITPGGNT